MPTAATFLPILCFESDYGTLPEPSREGFEFAGWFTDAVGGSAVSENTEVTTMESHTLYAHWELEKYSVKWTTAAHSTIIVNRTYSPNGNAANGVLSSGATVYYGDVLNVNYSTEAGYHIDDCGASSITVTRDVTPADIYVIVGEGVSYTLFFNANGGTVTEQNRNVKSGVAYGTLPTPSRSGYRFDGWYTAQSGGSAVSSSVIMGDSNQTIYAHWSLLQYSVSWSTPNHCSISVRRTKSPNANASTGSLSSGAKVYYGDELTVSYSTDTGYYLESYGPASVTVTGNVGSETIYANVRSNPTYTLYFNANGGSVSEESRKVKSGLTYGDLPSPSRTGYSFDGWYTSKSGGSQVYSSTKMGDSDKTVYAHWTLKKYTVSWNSVNNCTITVKRTSSPYGGASTGTLTSGARVYYGDKLSVTYTDVPVHYHIDKSGPSSITVTRDVTSSDIYAVVSIDKYNLKFEANGGYLPKSESSREVAYGNRYGDLPTPTWEHHTFDGWHTAASAGTKVTSATIMGTSDVTLYAHWSWKEYKVSWKNNNGYTVTVRRTSSPNARERLGTLDNGAKVYYGDVLEVTYTPNKGYGITGKGATSITVTRDITSSDIYATAELNNYWLYFEPNGGTMPEKDKSRQVKYGNKYGDLPTPTWSGHRFVGWFTSPNGGTRVYSTTTMGDGDVYLYAHWE